MNFGTAICFVCAIFFPFMGMASQGLKDPYVRKCERWKSYQALYSSPHYEVIKDESLNAQKDSKHSTLKILLPNGLKVLLISDPALTESAASISVEAGTWDDPDEYPGMAHFIEHLLFLGTEKYPKESDYSQYILERGGQYNAYTKHDRTSYGFSVPHGAFTGALDRLSHFFIDPLFHYSAIQREVHAVHHEFEDSIENDSLRVWRILKESGNPEHPNVKLSCGNLESLSRIKRSDIVQWFQKHYHPQQMRLVLMSNESLQSLAEKASHYFSKIPSKEKIDHVKIERKEMTSCEQRGNFIYVKPAFKNRSLFLMWEIPSYFLTLENSKAVHLLHMALDHGYSNGLAKILEREALAQEVHADVWRVGQEHGFFMINIVLTDEGMAQHEEVITKCFQALSGIKTLGIPEYLLRRLEHIESSRLYSSFESYFDCVMKVSSELLDEDISSYPDRTYTFKPDTVTRANDLLLQLNPSRCLYFLVAAPEEVGVKLSRIEKWMRSEYVFRKIPEEKLSSWSKAPSHPLIGFQPEEENVAPKRDTPYLETEIDEKEIPDPIFVIDNEKARIRWIEASTGSGAVDAFFCIATPLIGSSAKHTALNEIYIQRLDELLKQEFYSDSGVFWNLEIEGLDLCVFLSVPEEKYLEYFRRFFSLLKSSSVSKSQFEKAKKKKLDSYPGDPAPMEYAHQILDSFLRPFYYTKMELYHALVQMTFDEYEAFQRSYFKKIFLEGAFLGGASQEQIVRLWEDIADILDVEPYDHQKDRSKQFVFPKDSQAYCVVQKTHRKGNALLLLVEAGEATKDLGAIHKILTSVLHSEFFDALRTKQQTAYRLYTWNELINQKICHCFGLQSSTHTPWDLLFRVENFLSDFSARFSQILTQERFETIQDTLILNAEKQKQSMDKREDVAFVDEGIQSLKSLTYEKVLSEISSVFSKDNRNRIAILIEGSQQSSFAADDFRGIPYVPIEKEKFHR